MNEDTSKNETPEVQPEPALPPFYRKHTFLKKGPNGTEKRNYMRSSAIFLPVPRGSEPMTTTQIDAYFAEQRAARYPEQAAQNAAHLAKRAARRANDQKAEVRGYNPHVVDE